MSTVNGDPLFRVGPLAVRLLVVLAALLAGIAASAASGHAAHAIHDYDGAPAATTPSADTLVGAIGPHDVGRQPSRSHTPVSGDRLAAKAGDLSWLERRKIQKAVDAAGRPITVVGSAARGERRNRWKKWLPYGKGPGTRSDIDYAAPRSSLPYFDDHLENLPGLDPRHGIIPGPPDPNIGPGIRFEPRG